MDSAEQVAGEKRVQALLIDPLTRLGLAKPSTVREAQFQEMLAEVKSKLAYMSAESLAALSEQVAANPDGKQGDRFPIAVKILKWAAQIQPPGDDASPLVRAVFAAQLGRDSLIGGWAPELLAEVKRIRRWPLDYGVTQIKDRASDSVGRLRKLDDRLQRGLTLTTEEDQWRSRRLMALQKCRDIADLSERKGAME